jgi:hypothetical protein
MRWGSSMKHLKLLGKGMTAEVYEIDDDKGVKLFFKNIPSNWIEYEYSLAQKVGELYGDAPKAYGIKTFDNRTGIVLRRPSVKKCQNYFKEILLRQKSMEKKWPDYTWRCTKLKQTHYLITKINIKSSYKVSLKLWEKEQMTF